MSKPVNKVSFWKERIDLAKEQKHLHYSVYLANDVLWKKINDAHQKVVAKIIGPNDSVLDVGCGYGRLSEWFANYVGVDFSPDFINEAESLYPSKKFLVADLKNLPFEDNTFDFAVAVSIKNMIVGNLGEAEWEEMLKEIKRVCKKVLILEYGTLENYQDTEETMSQYEIL